MDSRRAEQIEELEGFESMLECFNGALSWDREHDPVQGHITINFPPLESRLSVFVDLGDDVQYRSVGVLAPATLHFILPPSYPSVAPELKIECPWMDDKMLSSMNAKMGEECSLYADSPMLYATAFSLQENACKEFVSAYLRVDNTPYAVAKYLDGRAMLRLMVEAAETAEARIFESDCHDCEVCLENVPGTRATRFRPCAHTFCNDCVTRYFQGLLKSETIRAFECLSEGCSSLAAQGTVKRSIGEEEFERYEKILLERALGNMEDMTVCPRPSCGKYAAISPLNRNMGTCDECAFTFCILCRKANHGMDPCHLQDDEKEKLLKEYENGGNHEELARKAGGHAALEKIITAIKNDNWLKENSKNCPKCKAHIEKNHGCNKMKCSKCDTAFCWLCGVRLDGDPYSHFSGDGTCANRLFEGAGEGLDFDPYDLDDMEDDLYSNGSDFYDEMDDFEDPEFFMRHHEHEGLAYEDFMDDPEYEPEDPDYEPEDPEYEPDVDEIPQGEGEVLGWDDPTVPDPQMVVDDDSNDDHTYGEGDPVEGVEAPPFEIGQWIPPDTDTDPDPEINNEDW